MSGATRGLTLRVLPSVSGATRGLTLRVFPSVSGATRGLTLRVLPGVSGATSDIVPVLGGINNRNVALCSDRLYYVLLPTHQLSPPPVR